MGRHLRRYPVAGVAFGAPSTCKQHTPQTTANLVAHGGAHNSPTQLALARAAVAMSSAPTNEVSKRVRGYKELPSVCVSMPTAHNAQNQQSGAAQTCTQPRSELPIVGAGCGAIPAPISGRRRWL